MPNREECESPTYTFFGHRTNSSGVHQVSCIVHAESTVWSFGISPPHRTPGRWTDVWKYRKVWLEWRLGRRMDMWAYGFGCWKVMFVFEGIYGTSFFVSFFDRLFVVLDEGTPMCRIKFQFAPVLSYDNAAHGWRWCLDVKYFERVRFSFRNELVSVILFTQLRIQDHWRSIQVILRFI